MTAPTLVYGVGATKAGTSWLYTYLQGHPDTVLQPFKEAHFWRFEGAVEPSVAMADAERLIGRATANYEAAKSTGDANWMATTSRNASAFWRLLNMHHAPSVDAYLATLDAMADGSPIVADFTPSYALADTDTLARMQDIGRPTRFIYMLRDPIDRLWSHFRMNRGREGEKSWTLAERFEAWMSGKSPEVTARSDYKGTLGRLRTAVPRENLYIGFFEELFTQDGVNAVCDFLGLAHHKGDFGHRVWASKDEAMPSDLRARAREALRHQYTAVEAMLGRVPASWDDAYQRAA